MYSSAVFGCGVWSVPRAGESISGAAWPCATGCGHWKYSCPSARRPAPRQLTAVVMRRQRPGHWPLPDRERLLGTGDRLRARVPLPRLYRARAASDSGRRGHRRPAGNRGARAGVSDHEHPGRPAGARRDHRRRPEPARRWGPDGHLPDRGGRLLPGRARRSERRAGGGVPAVHHRRAHRSGALGHVRQAGARHDRQRHRRGVPGGPRRRRLRGPVAQPDLLGERRPGGDGPASLLLAAERGPAAVLLELLQELRPRERPLVADELGPEGLHERGGAHLADAEEPLDVAPREELPVARRPTSTPPPTATARTAWGASAAAAGAAAAAP